MGLSMSLPKCFYEQLPPDDRAFVALYSDGSGAALFRREGAGYKRADGLDMPDAQWFADSGFLWFIPLPVDFKLWYERN